MTEPSTPNQALLALQGAKAERFVFEDPVTALFRLRQFGEVG